MAKLASKVILIEGEPALTATAFLQERALNHPRIEIRCGEKVEEFIGDSKVEAIKLLDVRTGRKEEVKVDGVLVYVGIEPNTKYLEGVVPLDEEGQIIVNDKLETEIPHILSAGDIRRGSSRQVATAVGDGAMVAITAQKLLQALT
jgi:thioredoxin reductase (NADPH)